MGHSLPNLQHLLACYEVGARGSVSAAARTVHRSQPAVTQAINSLERHFEAALFSRNPAGMALTAAGDACLTRIARALKQVSDGLAEAGGRRPGEMAALPHVRAAHLSSLSAVVQAGGFASAARLTGLSRASLHRAARALERQLGATLFETTSFGVTPTREAQRLVRRVRLAVSELAQAAAEVQALKGRPSGRTVIGAMPLARGALVPEAILAFTAAYPAHIVSVLDGPYANMLLELRHGGADVLIGALRDPAPADDILQEHLFDDSVAIAMRAGHPLLRAAGDPGHYPWIAPQPGSPLRLQFDQMCKLMDWTLPAELVECNSFSAARALLQSSERLMLLSAQQVSRDLEAGTLAMMPLPGAPVTRRIGLTVRKEWRPTAVQQELLRCLRAAAARLSTPMRGASASLAREIAWAPRPSRA